jgi:hypothetical protein
VNEQQQSMRILIENVVLRVLCCHRQQAVWVPSDRPFSPSSTWAPRMGGTLFDWIVWG